MVRLKTALENLNGGKIGGTPTNNTEIETDGTIKFNGDATVYDDEYAAYFIAPSGTPAPDVVVLSGNIFAYGFDGTTTTEYLYANIELPHKYKEGSDIEVHVHFLRKQTGSGDVKFFVEYAIAPLVGALVASQTISAVKTVPAVDVADVMTVGIIPGANLKISDVICLRLSRVPTDAQDTFAADVLVTSFGIHYELDTLGSRTRYSK